MRCKLGVIPAAVLLFFFASLSQGDAQSAAQDRISGSISNGPLFTLTANVPAKAQTRYDQGPAPASLQMANITLMLAPTTQQHAALQQLLTQQQEKTSPNFHKWLTPEQYADQFGLTQNDIGKITVWLQAQGFTMEKPARARNWVAFDGTAGQVQAAFHTQIHNYLVDGKVHYANATAPAIPLALAGIVSDIRGLHDFHPEAPKYGAGPQAKAHPIADFTNGTVGAGNEFIAPGDLATIYDIAPLYLAGTDGAGQKIAIVGQTDIVTSDITDYQTLFALPVVAPTVMLYGPDPCGGNILNCNPDDQFESDLDLEVSNAVATNATIFYATSTDVFTSAMEVIDNDLAPVMSMSYGGCEQINQDGLAAIQAIAQQGAAEGITWLASSGDSGAAGCDTSPGETEATQGLAVNIPASIPEVTGVGGTEFNEGGNYSAYWGAANGPTGGSALSYIPEIAWNDTTEVGALNATGGGISIFYPLPGYQTGVSGIQGSMRNVPDVSLSASPVNDGYFVCAQLSCEMSSFFAVGGTSASTPAFAGMVVLLNQFLETQGTQPTPLGNINPSLYSLAEMAIVPAPFHDITTGNNIVPCMAGSTGCPGSGSYGYSASAGYDPVTGLGSVDADVLITNWVEVSLAPTTTTLTASATTINPGDSVTLTATVAPVAGGGTPTGTVTFLNSTTSLGTGTLSGGVATLTTTALPTGADSITATYGGDATFAGSVSSPVIITVNAPPGFSVSSSPTNLTVSVGGTATSTITVTSAGGFTQAVNFTCSGAPSEATCSVMPSSITPPANGTATAALTITTTAPSTIFGHRRMDPGPPTPLLVFAIGLMGLMGLALAHKSFTATGNSLRWPAMAGVIVLAAVGMASCGGGGGSSGNPGTPAGSYTIVVTGTSSGVTTQVLSVPLSVNALGLRLK